MRYTFDLLEDIDNLVACRATMIAADAACVKRHTYSLRAKALPLSISKPWWEMCISTICARLAPPGLMVASHIQLNSDDTNVRHCTMHGEIEDMLDGLYEADACARMGISATTPTPDIEILRALWNKKRRRATNTGIPWWDKGGSRHRMRLISRGAEDTAETRAWSDRISPHISSDIGH